MADVWLLDGDAVAGDPEAVESLAGSLRDLASTVGQISYRLNSDTLLGTWSGEAAAAFSMLLHETPQMLNQAQLSFEEADRTLYTYGGELRKFVGVAQTLAGELEQALAAESSAQQRLGFAQQAADSANQQLNYAGGDPTAQVHAMTAMDNAASDYADAKGAIAGAQEQIARIRREAAENHAQFQGAVTTCCNGLDHSLDIGFKNSLGSAIGRYAGDIGGVLSALAAVVVKAVSLLPDIVRWVQHPSLEGFHKILEDAGALLTLVAVVLTAVVCVFQPECAPLLVAVVDGALVGSRVATAGALGIDGIQVLRGKGNLWNIGFDTLGFLTSGAGSDAKYLTASRSESAAAAAARAAGANAHVLGGYAGWATRNFNLAAPGIMQGAAQDGGLDFAHHMVNDYIPGANSEVQPYIVSADGTAPITGNSLFQRLSNISIGASVPASA